MILCFIDRCGQQCNSLPVIILKNLQFSVLSFSLVFSFNGLVYCIKFDDSKTQHAITFPCAEKSYPKCLYRTQFCLEVYSLSTCLLFLSLSRLQNHMLRKALFLVLSALACASLASALTLTQTRAVLQAGVNHAIARKVNVHIAVVDASGMLAGFYRMDSTSASPFSPSVDCERPSTVLGPLDISIKKAKSAALFGVPNELIGEQSRPGRSALASFADCN